MFSLFSKTVFLLLIRPTVFFQAETDLRFAQAEYDKQVEITKLLMEGLDSIQTNHLMYLKDFVEAQVKYYAECHQAMQDLSRELSR